MVFDREKIVNSVLAALKRPWKYMYSNKATNVEIHDEYLLLKLSIVLYMYADDTILYATLEDKLNKSL